MKTTATWMSERKNLNMDMHQITRIRKRSLTHITIGRLEERLLSQDHMPMHTRYCPKEEQYC